MSSDYLCPMCGAWIHGLPEIPDTMPPSRLGGPETSSEAATAAEEYAPKKRLQILAYILSRGAEGATDDEGQRALGIRVQTYTPRRYELVKEGFVVDSGMRRRTISGCRAIVWVVPEFAAAGGEA